MKSAIESKLSYEYDSEMKKMKIVLISFLMGAILISCVEKKGIVAEADLHFFYLELCPGCESYEMAEKISESVVQLGGQAVNIIHDEDAQLLKSILTEKNMADISHSLPLLVLEDTYYVGYEEIAQHISILED